MTEKEIDKKLKALEALQNGTKTQGNTIWEKEYAQMSFEEKVTYWSASIHQQMRWNNESGVDEMGVFSKQDYDYWKSQEPDIDLLLPHIIQKLPVSEEKVYQALGK